MSDTVLLFVVGAHLSGMVLNHELVSLKATLVRTARTLPDYRLYALGTTPPKPGLIREPGSLGPGIEGEIWSLSPAAFGAFVSRIPAPLGIGKVALEGGEEVSGFLCEPYAIRDAREITALGGWRAHIAMERAKVS
jgi:allophanate hydrolase